MGDGGSISVAMCTYNGTAYVREQLESIAAQTVAPGEVIVSDDGSSDGTVGVVREFAATAPFKVQVHENETNVGATANFERAIELCSGEFIALADQDDVWAPEKLERLHAALKADARAGYAFCDAALVHEDRRDVGGKTLLARRFALEDIRRKFEAGREMELMLKRDFIYGTTLMFRASARAFVLPIPATWSHDTWIVNVLAAFGWRGAPVLEPLVRYRQHGVQASGGMGAPKSVGYGDRLRAYDDLWAHLVAVRDRTGRELAAGVLQRIDEKQQYLRAVMEAEEMPPHRRLPALAREVISGRWRRYSPRTILVDKRLDVASRRR